MYQTHICGAAVGPAPRTRNSRTAHRTRRCRRRLQLASRDIIRNDRLTSADGDAVIGEKTELQAWSTTTTASIALAGLSFGSENGKSASLKGSPRSKRADIVAVLAARDGQPPHCTGRRGRRRCRAELLVKVSAVRQQQSGAPKATLRIEPPVPGYAPARAVAAGQHEQLEAAGRVEVVALHQG